MSKLIAVPLNTVEIQRGKDVHVRDVPEHEVRVLRAIHRDVRVINKDAGEIELDGNAFAEYLRLQNTYRQTGQKDPALVAYPGGARELEAFGFAFDDDRADVGAPQSMVKNHAKDAKKSAAKKAKPAE